MSLETFTRIEVPRLSGPVEHDVRERARQRGHAAGYADGMRAAHDEARRDAERAHDDRRRVEADDRRTVAAAVDALASAAADYSARADELADLTARRVQQLAVDLAETILERELSDPTRAALTAATRAGRASADDAAAIVQVHPDDAATLARLDAGAGLTLEASPDLTRGDAVVRLPDGQIDLRVAAALARVRAVLEETS